MSGVFAEGPPGVDAFAEVKARGSGRGGGTRC
jgi:hypothetical protein